MGKSNYLTIQGFLYVVRTGMLYLRNVIRVKLTSFNFNPFKAKSVTNDFNN
jgi:hypothetical protein